MEKVKRKKKRETGVPSGQWCRQWRIWWCLPVLARLLKMVAATWGNTFDARPPHTCFPTVPHRYLFDGLPSPHPHYDALPAYQEALRHSRPQRSQKHGSPHFLTSRPRRARVWIPEKGKGGLYCCCFYAAPAGFLSAIWLFPPARGMIPVFKLLNVDTAN